MCNFNRHTMQHTGEKPFKCTNCDYRCKPFRCTRVVNSFSTTNSVKAHMLIHTGYKTFSSINIECTKCDYKFRSFLYTSLYCIFNTSKTLNIFCLVPHMILFIYFIFSMYIMPFTMTLMLIIFVYSTQKSNLNYYTNIYSGG